MVSAKNYLETYFNATRERNNILMGKIAKKSNKDVRMLKKKPTSAQVAELIALIGTSEQPVKGKINEQPIRRPLWQMNKSADFFAKKKPGINPAFLHLILINFSNRRQS